MGRGICASILHVLQRGLSWLGLVTSSLAGLLILFISYSSVFQVAPLWAHTYHSHLLLSPYVLQLVLQTFLLILAASIFWHFAQCVRLDPGTVPFLYCPDVELQMRSNKYDERRLRRQMQVTDESDAYGTDSDNDDDLPSYCTKCSQYRPPHAHHCSMCGACILVWDHHCPWINNCVGHGTRKWFLSFVLSLFVGTAVVTLLALPLFLFDRHAHVTICFVTCAAVGACMFGFAGWHLHVASLGITTYEFASSRRRVPSWKERFANVCTVFGTRNVFLWILPNTIPTQCKPY
jgi:hypothetical protein